MKSFIFGIIFTLVCIAAGLYMYFARGYAPVATSAPPMPFEKKLANMALEAQVEKLAPKNAPIQAGEEALAAGAAIYKMYCATCHGLPGAPPTPIAKGEYPQPPQLFKGQGVTDDPPGETYWKVANGIRLTGMPAFNQSLSETQMWQVSLLLKNADKLPPSVQQALGSPVEVQGTTGGGGSEREHDR